MRVLVVFPGLGPEGGAEQSLLALAPGLVDCGVALHVAVLGTDQGLVPDLERCGVVVHDLSGTGGTLRRAVALRRLADSVRPDVVHATLWQATLATQIAFADRSQPVLVTWAVTPNVDDGATGGRVARSKRRTVELVDAVLGRLAAVRYHAVTAGVARTMGTALRVPAERILVAERGRDVPLEPSRLDRGPVLAALGVPGHGRVVLAVGRQDIQKGYPDLIDAFDRVAVAVPDAHLVVAGRPGSDSERIAAALQRASHGDRIHLVGHRDDVAVLQRCADVAVCSSLREGAAGALLEAMAVGLPVVTVRLDGLEGVLTDGLDALVVERAELADGLERMLGDPALAERLAERARRTFRERFTRDAAVERMRSVYEWAAGRPSSAGTV